MGGGVGGEVGGDRGGGLCRMRLSGCMGELVSAILFIRMTPPTGGGGVSLGASITHPTTGWWQLCW